jgi:hypothetical protein
VRIQAQNEALERYLSKSTEAERLAGGLVVDTSKALFGLASDVTSLLGALQSFASSGSPPAEDPTAK